ncbi:S-adenosyl-L-methionine-dependent methyltransferases superfamily protein [Wolffia australiana]
MAGPSFDESDAAGPPRASLLAADLISDDDRSVAADSWSIKSEYGSTLDDEQRQVDAVELLSAGNARASSEYSSDKDDADANEVEPSLLGLQSYWDAAYAEDLANFKDHGHAGEIWFGADVMDTVVTWTKNLLLDSSDNDAIKEDFSGPVLDIGTGNGLLLQEFAKLGFTDLTGTDYSEGAVELAQSLAARAGFPGIKFLVDDILETKLERQFDLVMDKGTLDAVGLHPDGPLRRSIYWDSVAKLVSPGGILVLTSCNSTKDELIREVERLTAGFWYVDHVKTYPTIMFGGVEGSRVATVAFRRH